MFSLLIVAVATQFLPTPRRYLSEPSPYPHPTTGCYGTYQRLTNEAEAAQKRYDYAMASRKSREASTRIARCLQTSATSAERNRYRYSFGRSLWIAGEMAYAAGDRDRACALVARGRHVLAIEVRGERDPKRIDVIGEWIHQGRRDLRGNWSPWEVAGGLRAPLDPDRPCPQNVSNNPTDPKD